MKWKVNAYFVLKKKTDSPYFSRVIWKSHLFLVASNAETLL